MSTAPDRQPETRELPTTFTDHEGRSITVSEYTGDVEPLVEMYEHFDSTSRSQGLPPRTEPQIRDWLEGLLEDGLNTVATHGDDVVGHAVLIPFEDTSELAIFVRPAYQSAGIGTELIRGLLGYGKANGVDHVWLTVSRDNRIAMKLYKSAGFETTAQDRGEHEMELAF